MAQRLLGQSRFWTDSYQNIFVRLVGNFYFLTNRQRLADQSNLHQIFFNVYTHTLFSVRTTGHLSVVGMQKQGVSPAFYTINLKIENIQYETIVLVYILNYDMQSHHQYQSWAVLK